MANISRAVASEISKEIEAAAAKILDKHGLKASPTRTGYGDSYSFKIEAVAVEAGRSGVNLKSKEAMTFILAMGVKGLTEQDLGAQVVINGKRYTITGASLNAKFPLIGMRDDGKSYRLPESDEIIALIKAAR
ncbi:hypothetical protein UFOVP1184_30 [uncultured Caudovirales phage]|jgi:hypothetical protein|uniref:Uncharacterized protein n=1 Tax=uncultured Caudovirales phage TaxID=2100421 RepID=A0A6J5QZY2_9CAUD|nr:hypothetical protein UFOVP1184_30 [uncultured Caudovirales phage]